MGVTPNPAQFDIWLATVQYGHSMDPRPVLVIDKLPNDRFLVMTISGQMELFKNAKAHLRIERRDPDYDKTGLPRDECFIDGSELRAVALADFIKQYGILCGELQTKFEKWF